MRSVRCRCHRSETSRLATYQRRYVRRAVEKKWQEEWERESDIGELGGGPVGKETDAPVGSLDVCVDRWYDIVAPV